MCRIGGLDEKDFMNHNSEFRIDSDAAPKWMNSVLYRLSYYRYGQMNIGIVLYWYFIIITSFIYYLIIVMIPLGIEKLLKKLAVQQDGTE